MNKLIAKYNASDSLLFISSYPERGVRYSKKVCAVGGFTKNTIEQMGHERKYVVLTVKIGKKTQIYEEGNVLICRVIDRNNPLSFISLGTLLTSFTLINKVVVEFEFGSFGTIINTAFFALIFLLNKIIQKETYTVVHQVVNNINDLNGHLGWKKTTLKSIFFGTALNLYYRYITLLSTKVIATEELFRRKLIELTGKSEKIVFIPHGVDTTLRQQSKFLSRKKLGLPQNKKIILYFGYLGWYKGADIFFDFAKHNTDNDNYFVIAGGHSFTNGNKSYYKEYLKKFEKIPSNLKITGFVPEDEINLYYSASDVVILPYRYMMSSSGPLSLAFSMEKPVLLSEKLYSYTLSNDIRESLEDADLKPQDIFFKLNEGDFNRKLNKANLDRLANFSSLMREKRAYKRIVSQYDDLFKQSDKDKLFLLSLNSSSVS